MTREFAGILVVNKPKGMSSAFVDRVCKRALGVKKIGHLGTLDPFATGVLALAINSATKLIQYMPPHKKTYEFEIMFGEKMNSGDVTGTVTNSCKKIPTPSEISEIIPRFIGEIYQKPHIFSAVSINGKRSYKLARSGQIPVLKAKKITIFKLKLLRSPSIIDMIWRYFGSKKHRVFRFMAEVSQGTYIRSLAEDISKELGTFGYVLTLKRIKDGNFCIEHAISLDDLLRKKHNIGGDLIPLDDVLDDIPVIALSDQDAADLELGRAVAAARPAEVVVEGQCLAKSDSGFLGIVFVNDGLIVPKKLIRKSKGEKDVDNG